MNQKMYLRAVEVHSVFTPLISSTSNNVEKYRSSELYIEKVGVEGKSKGSFQLSSWTSGVN